MRQSSEVLFVGPELPEHFVSELDELFESFRCFGASSFWQKLELGLGHGVSTFKAESIRLFPVLVPGMRRLGTGCHHFGGLRPDVCCLTEKPWRENPLVAADMGRYGGFLSHGGTHKSSTLIIGFSIINQPL